jgi:hypothetical protein
VVTTTAAACAMQLGIGVKRIVKAGHNVLLIGLKNDSESPPLLRTALFPWRPRLVQAVDPALPAPLSAMPCVHRRFGRFRCAASVFPLLSYSGSVPALKKFLTRCCVSAFSKHSKFR